MTRIVSDSVEFDCGNHCCTYRHPDCSLVDFSFCMEAVTVRKGVG